MTGVAVLAVFRFEVRDGARYPCFQHRIRRRQGGERQGLKQGDGLNAEPAKVQRLSSRNQLHGYDARVFRVPPKGIPDQCVKLRSALERVKLATFGPRGRTQRRIRCRRSSSDGLEAGFQGAPTMTQDR